MAELLKDKYPVEVAEKISKMICEVHPTFDSVGFVGQVRQGYEQLELMARARKIAVALTAFLPADFETAQDILLASLDSSAELDENNSVASFLYMPHTMYISDNGLEYFDISMQALYQLTQRFTAEFAIRPFIQRYPEKSLALLAIWASDSNLHVRRLVSEGTRPRLPWASRLLEYIKDPTAVVRLLELLKDDPELYVRRSVANNLNDIGKDHPALLADIAKRWLKDASKDRTWLVKHGLRSAIKRGEKGALQVLGYDEKVDVKIKNVAILPAKAQIGKAIQVSFDVANLRDCVTALMVDFSIHFIKANGKANPKVFKLKAIELGPQKSHKFSKKVSLKVMTTRTLYTGTHKVEAIINGKNHALGSFELVR
ncbi:MAG: DNA alkylation repair protein [Paraglaciecola sp.]|uniref:DNA alkylation repair protein n=1 Tax=Paraglaciecola sp. TaxID=1920173 RepID=UPI00329818FB